SISLTLSRRPMSSLFPYTTLFRSHIVLSRDCPGKSRRKTGSYWRGQRFFCWCAGGAMEGRNPLRAGSLDCHHQGMGPKNGGVRSASRCPSGRLRIGLQARRGRWRNCPVAGTGLDHVYGANAPWFLGASIALGPHGKAVSATFLPGTALHARTALDV